MTLHRTTQFKLVTALLGADFIVFSFINPKNAPAAWLIIGYALLGVSIFAIASLFARSLKSYGDGVYKAAQRFLRYAAAVAVLIVGLQSVGQLSIRDLLALIPLAALAYWYFGYNKSATTS